METRDERVFVPFTQEELNEIASVLSEVYQKKESLESELDGIKKQFKADIEGCVNEIGDCARKIRERGLYERVRCHVVRDFTEKEVYIIRCDTCEIVRYRSMRPNEYQTTLDDFTSDNGCKSIDELKASFYNLQEGEEKKVKIGEALFYGTWPEAVEFRRFLSTNGIDFGPGVKTDVVFRNIVLTKPEPADEVA